MISRSRSTTRFGTSISTSRDVIDGLSRSFLRSRPHLFNGAHDSDLGGLIGIMTSLRTRLCSWTGFRENII